ncbi:hypothetical protein ACFRCW_30160 [Streptomyces sp. NPDC056653]|uniref:hypothetical protein n=1 Tax=Streptomyces sp. NPDC056653 TaxID=3345894 RepID=UPI0036C1D520
MLVYPSGVDVSGSALRFLADRLKARGTLDGTPEQREMTGLQEGAAANGMEAADVLTAEPRPNSESVTAFGRTLM